MPHALRPATEQDRDWLFALHRASMQTYVELTWGPWDDEKQRALFEAVFAPARLQIIQVGGRDAGLLHVEQEAQEIFLGSIELDPEYQNRGTGTAVLRDLLAEAGARRQSVRLQVLKANPAARRLYERLGFAVFEENATHLRLRWQPA